MLVAGLDEAGRGPVLGPLVIGCVVMEENNLHILEELGIDDSKRLSPKKRIHMASEIKKHCLIWDTYIVTPKMINDLHYKSRITLNQIEEQHFALVLNNLTQKPDQIFLDACDPVEERFGKTIGSQLTFKPKEIISKHKGDAIFKIVGASSILAKVKRDEILASYVEEYGEIGSGYPSDPKTQNFLKKYYHEHQLFPPIVRTWWKTAENIKKEFHLKKTQRKLTDF